MSDLAMSELAIPDRVIDVRTFWQAVGLRAVGTAIDINVERSDYWAWANRRGRIAYRNRIPNEIAAIFEAHGFIWGGKWYHFDTMHFEYRPELL